MILWLTRFGIAAGAVEKGWAAYRKQNRPDLSDKIVALLLTQVARCVLSTNPASRLERGCWAATAFQEFEMRVISQVDANPTFNEEQIRPVLGPLEKRM
jgi:hypothetical protein